MSDTTSFAALVLLASAVGVAAVLSNRVTERLRVPAPALMLAAAAIAVAVVPDLHRPSEHDVDRLVTVALVLILFDGGMGIGWARFRAAVAPIAVVGVIGTFLTTAGVAVVAHWLLGVDWYAAVLLGTALAPTDPAVVFSVLGQREVSGRSGTILEGESGANDPVGIALMASLLSAGELSSGAVPHVIGEFALQMVVGVVVGVAGGYALLWFMRRVPLPGEGLYPLRTLLGAFALYGLAAVGHGSGFLAVFVAGILVGEARAPYKREIESFHSGLASLAEIVAFVVLGLTVDLSTVSRSDVWVPGIALAVVLSFVVRPLVLGPLLVPSRLSRRERGFVLFAGLKGAVPVLLGSYLLAADVTDADRLYGVVVVVVMFSVVVQGSLLPWVARILRVPVRVVEPEPWTVAVRLRDEPHGVHRFRVMRGSRADGATIAGLDEMPEEAWVSFVVRAGQLVAAEGGTTLTPGDEVLVLGDPADRAVLKSIFERRPDAH